jgi:hypothetical protein
LIAPQARVSPNRGGAAGKHPKTTLQILGELVYPTGLPQPVGEIVDVGIAYEDIVWKAIHHPHTVLQTAGSSYSSIHRMAAAAHRPVQLK